LSFYHFAEFATVARYNPEILNIDSFLVNQVSARMWLVPALHSCLSLFLCHRAYTHNHARTSFNFYSFTLYASLPPSSTPQKAYLGAMKVAICEYFVEASFLPSIKGLALFRLLGLAGMAFGEFLRKGALIQVRLRLCMCAHSHIIHPRVSLCLCLACVRLCLCVCSGVCAGSAPVCEKGRPIVRHTPRAYPV